MRKHTTPFGHFEGRIDRRDPQPPRLLVDRLLRERRRSR
jgi:hypothetical protein